MSRPCSVCRSARRGEVESALVSGESLRNIAKQFKLGATAVFRHKQDHIPIALMKAAEAREEQRDVTHGEDLLEQIRDLNERTLRILAEAEAAGDSRTALAAIREARGNSELLCKMLMAIEAAKREEEPGERPVGDVLENIRLALFGRTRMPVVSDSIVHAAELGESREEWTKQMLPLSEQNRC